jgi:hypothetical protein
VALSFIQAQSQAIRFWGRQANRDNELLTRVAFEVTDERGTRTISFARDVDDYLIEEQEEPDGAPCCPDPGCSGNPCTFPGYADNH